MHVLIQYIYMCVCVCVCVCVLHLSSLSQPYHQRLAHVLCSNALGNTVPLLGTLPSGFGLTNQTISLFASELQKLSSLGLEPRIVFQGCGHCSCVLLIKSNNFGLGDVLLSCLVSKIQKPSSLGFKPRTIFGVLTFLKSLSSFKE
jgi:hypothetical protein